ncbi:universal stress protein [Ulvibacter litoralis]|uniref:Nucleotide-binding universal stress protein, UspA family n=1 Tax=Ulvibacter litoralis TaxID=227084 RepID=A0A1G7DU17_9FLAO|nr:universal stress protein [Ulvibacter litoralis]GHC42310.1 universal stress protein UspA [Ulvibacter litoralis]SDE54951.1 Nucleotide-binding universal stress protein, UspA family [Ulvibacter litoralis]
MKRILVPTDFSSQAENALKVAAELALKHGSEIYLLHSLEMPLSIGRGADPSNLPESLFFIKLAEKNFSELLEKPYLQEIDVHEAIGHDEIYNDISNTVEKNNIDLVIMGSHGASGFKEMFIGSNTEKVVRTSTIPVLVIKNAHASFEINDFVFATDFSEECRWSFNEAQKFAKNAGAKMHLLFVNTPSDFKTTLEANEIMKNFVSGMGAENYTLNIYNDTSIEKGILQFAKDTKAQLIGMSTHGRKGISHFFNGSVSEDLVNHANMPVITFRIQ